MNKEQIKKHLFMKHVKLDPSAILITGDGEDKRLTEAVWLVSDITTSKGMFIECISTAHGFLLGWDKLKQFTSNEIERDVFGYLRLTVQVILKGNRVQLTHLDHQAFSN